MPGPKPMPTQLKVLRGNPGRRRLNNLEPEPGPSRKKVPSWLPSEAKQYWNDLHPMLERLGVMTEADELALAGLCATYAAWREAYAFLQEHGTAYKTVSTAGDVLWKSYPQVQVFSDMGKQLRVWLVEFGLSPSSRSKVKTITRKKDNGKKFFDFFG